MLAVESRNEKTFMKCMDLIDEVDRLVPAVEKYVDAANTYEYRSDDPAELHDDISKGVVEGMKMLMSLLYLVGTGRDIEEEKAKREQEESDDKPD